MPRWRVTINYHPITGTGELYFDDAYLLDVQLPDEQIEAIKEKILDSILKES